jgi:predicted  nucleic acid-binding Zn-ribbon protein
VTESTQDELRIRRALEIAENHLDGAESAMWEAAETTDREPLESDIDAIIQQIWSLQHDLNDVKHEIEQ